MRGPHKFGANGSNLEPVAKELKSVKAFGVKTPAVKAEQFLTDAKGNRTGVVVDMKTYERLREAEEELADIHTYDALQCRVRTEVATGKCVTLTSYRADRKRKAG